MVKAMNNGRISFVKSKNFSLCQLKTHMHGFKIFGNASLTVNVGDRWREMTKSSATT